MHITNAHTNQPNFGRRYLIKGDKEICDVIEKTIIPLYEAEKRKPIISLVPDDVFNKQISEKIDKIAEYSDYGKEWIVQNAKQYGVDVDFSKSNDIFVLSDEDFMNAYKFFTQSSIKDKANYLYNSLKIFFNGFKLKGHVRLLNMVNESNKRDKKAFYDFIYSKDVCEVKTLNELADKLSKE